MAIGPMLLANEPRGIRLRRMGIFERSIRVASANFNALLDKADSPEKSLDLLLREMREQLRAARGEVVRAVAAEKQLRNTLSELDRDIALWASRAELAIRHGKDDLARDALAFKRRLEAERARTEELRVQQRQNALEMKAEFERMERKMEEFSARQGTIAVLARQAAAGGGADGLGARAGEDPLSAWQDMEDRIDTLDAMLEAERELDDALGKRAAGSMTTSEVEAQFAALERSAAPSPDVTRDEEPPPVERKFRVEG